MGLAPDDCPSAHFGLIFHAGNGMIVTQSGKRNHPTEKNNTGPQQSEAMDLSAQTSVLFSLISILAYSSSNSYRKELYDYEKNE
ncbi:MAG: hypothetical protein IKI45_02840 [Oscillospiraceae bacterium]|nr:hypothetical protein [Oscillospiraceae bacterium]